MIRFFSIARPLLLALMVISHMVEVDGIALPSLFPFERQISMPAGCSDIQWTVDREAKMVQFKVISEVDAHWVGLGISENGGMKGADMMIVREAATSEEGARFEVQDSISLEYARPTADTLQNVQLLTARRNHEGRIEAILQRSLDTCDMDDIRLEPFKQHIICASGPVLGNGEIAYHGNQRSSIIVNLFVDEELLFDRKFDRASFKSESLSSSAVEISPGVIVHDNGATATRPYPIDIVMPNVTLDKKQTTSYMCRVIRIPRKRYVVAFESVWSLGETTSDGQAPPDYLHHQNIFQCNPDLVDPVTLDGRPYDCLNDMPGCNSIFSHAKSSVVQVPTGLSLPLDEGLIVLTVHYDNPNHIPIEDDRSGLRFWVLPDAQEDSTTEGCIVNHMGSMETIQIPPDPEQEDYDLQFMISSAATRATLPTNGVQALGTSIHMHKSGVRARLQHIRNGVHFEDVYNTLSYDFNLQSPIWKPWYLLPGDALIMTCTFRPDKHKPILGGLETSQEMCNFGVGFAPAVPGYAAAVGYLVRPDEPFRNSFIGRITNGTIGLELDYDQATFPPDSRDFISIKEHRENLCEKIVRDKTSMIRFSPSDPGAFALFVLLGSFILCYVLEHHSLFLSIRNERDRRNTTICAIQLLFSSIFAVPVLVSAVSLVPTKLSFDAVDPDQYLFLRGVINAQVYLYILELFYRINPRPEVILHHIFTVGLVLYLNFVSTYSFAFDLCIKLGTTLALLAVMDHPKNLALLLKNFGYASSQWWHHLCRGAGWWYILSKLVIVGSAAWLVYCSNSKREASWLIQERFSQWINHQGPRPSSFAVTVSLLLFGLLMDQLYTGFLLLKLADKYRPQNEFFNKEDSVEVAQVVFTTDNVITTPPMPCSGAKWMTAASAHCGSKGRYEMVPKGDNN